MDSWKDTMMREHQGMSGTPFEFPPPPKGSPPPRRVTATEQEPTHEYRAKRNEIRCRVCGALRAHPIHF